jgi:hypothetical protein
MSRGRDDDRSERPVDSDSSRSAGHGKSDRAWRNPSERESTERPRDDDRRADVPLDRLLLPQGTRREIVTLGDRAFLIRGSETRVLATVGAFRVVREDDLAHARNAQSVLVDVRHLSDDGFVERRTVPINHELTRILALSETGKRLLETHRDSDGNREAQAYHAGFRKHRELAHDAQLYRLYQSEAAEIAARGGRILRVVLEAELGRDYQAFLHRPRGSVDSGRVDDPLAFARDNDLSVVDGHLQLPDLRIEFEFESRIERRDLELVTEHYSGSSIAAKARAGFALFRAAGPHRGRGGTPHDPHHLRRFA